MFPDHGQAWLRYCYGFDLAFKHQALICEAIWNEHQERLPVGLMMKTRKRLIELVWLAVQEVAAQQMNNTYKQYTGALRAAHLGVSRSTWCEVYAPHWRMLKSAVVAFDVELLGNVLSRMHVDAFQDHKV
ncbi:bacteriophage antitermination protein Q [Lelliottia sp. V106_10]|uniref:bacteriophage antitermination protein Q n=1 Tax=Lelliottia wanjuensis TaxID=3050585 RepID=UPI00254AD972|nr:MULTISPECIES: bacteriophage antitermination protein Q [unclassified Lelliottia]MDK9356417.1 bacteriophage antitermination protein Q [Lelliottia sp. V106_16]MDK9375728.1 bacteriophage antitermination protein Q [Lelliottia sp. V106_10]MDK9602278.1 bacteriophage antitermination protein Q [Lelliottia sp. V106_5]